MIADANLVRDHLKRANLFASRGSPYLEYEPLLGVHYRPRLVSTRLS
jgi:hypothetical protein